MDLMELLSRHVDGYAVLVAVGFTQFIKYLLPTPPGGSRSDVTPTAHRCLPFVPIVIAVLTLLIKDYWLTATAISLGEGIVKGLVSGFAAVYIYQTSKVTIFGG